MSEEYSYDSDAYYNYRAIDRQAEQRDRLKNRVRELQGENHMLRERLREVGEEIMKEAWLRDKHPGLSEIWERYQLMLNLVKEQENG